MDTIKSRTDVSEVFSKGTRFGRGSSMILVLKAEEQRGRVGRVAFVAGKKLGNAVWRNRAKRRMRAAFASTGCNFTDADVVFIARRNTGDVSFTKLVEGYKQSFAEAGLKAD